MGAQMQPGNYYGHLKDAGTSETPKNVLYVWMRWEISSAWDGAAWKPIDPIVRDTVLYLSDDAMPYSEPKLRAMEFNGDYGIPLFAGRYTADGATLVCKHKPSIKDPTRNFDEWALEEWGGSGSFERERAPANRIKLLNAQWKNNQANAKKPSGPPPPPPKPPLLNPRPAAHYDHRAAENPSPADDLPF